MPQSIEEVVLYRKTLMEAQKTVMKRLREIVKKRDCWRDSERRLVTGLRREGHVITEADIAARIADSRYDGPSGLSLTASISSALEDVRKACNHPSLVLSKRMKRGDAEGAMQESSVRDAFRKLVEKAKVTVELKAVALATARLSLGNELAGDADDEAIEQWQLALAAADDYIARQGIVNSKQLACRCVSAASEKSTAEPLGTLPRWVGIQISALRALVGSGGTVGRTSALLGVGAEGAADDGNKSVSLSSEASPTVQLKRLTAVAREHFPHALDSGKTPSSSVVNSSRHSICRSVGQAALRTASNVNKRPKYTEVRRMRVMVSNASKELAAAHADYS